jgi:hypothetical protein
LTQAAISTLGLEASLLTQWRAFDACIEQFPASAATRQEAERIAEYSRNDVFVDSVVDALSLQLAGRSGFDTRFGSFLDLLLIQRAHEEDIALLRKLANKYAQEEDLVGLMGLQHRLHLYSGDERLTPVIEFCAEALARLDVPVDNVVWARSVGIQPTAESWSVGIRLGTAPPHYWIARRDELKPSDVSVELLVANSREWRIQVARLDRLYSAQWRPSGITVATEALRFKSLSAWPAASGQRLFPVFAMRLADYLQVSWTRLAWIDAQRVEINKAQLLEWLHSCVDEIRP